MGENSHIAWTTHTFNPWTRCTKVSPACDHCYAETWAQRARHPSNPLLPIWGPDAPRTPTSEHNWRQPIRWNREAQAAGRQARVFCASLADVFEDHAGITASGARERLWTLVWSTPWLDWLLLTKRPENMIRFAPEAWRERWPSNMWAGTTVEDQQRAEERIPHLLRVPARIRFLSVEPMLEAITLPRSAIELDSWFGSGRDGLGHGISWVICGGESGHHARPFDLAWARALRDQCRAAGVPFFMKQAGSNPVDIVPTPWGTPSRGVERHAGGRIVYCDRFSDRAGADPDEWPPDLRVQEFPQ